MKMPARVRRATQEVTVDSVSESHHHIPVQTQTTIDDFKRVWLTDTNDLRLHSDPTIHLFKCFIYVMPFFYELYFFIY